MELPRKAASWQALFLVSSVLQNLHGQQVICFIACYSNACKEMNVRPCWLTHAFVDTAGGLPIGSKDSQDLAWSRAVKFLKQNLA